MGGDLAEDDEHIIRTLGPFAEAHDTLAAVGGARACVDRSAGLSEDRAAGLISHAGAARAAERDRLIPAEPTITPEQTQRDAGISSKQQPRYQRRMSTLLAGRE